MGHICHVARKTANESSLRLHGEPGGPTASECGPWGAAQLSAVQAAPLWPFCTPCPHVPGVCHPLPGPALSPVLLCCPDRSPAAAGTSAPAGLVRSFCRFAVGVRLELWSAQAGAGLRCPCASGDRSGDGRSADQPFPPARRDLSPPAALGTPRAGLAAQKCPRDTPASARSTGEPGARAGHSACVLTVQSRERLQSFLRRTRKPEEAGLPGALPSAEPRAPRPRGQAG